MSTYLTVEDRRFLRAVDAGTIVRVADGRIFQRSTAVRPNNGRREKKLARAIAAGWVHEDPDPTTGRYSLTEQGKRDLAAREPETGAGGP